MRKPTIRRGFSMVELLIVIAIAMLLIAISIPLIQPMLASNRLREASRQVNTFFVGAKARAAEMGRPYGVRLVRSSSDQTGDPNDCYRLQYVEAPPYYSGDVDGALISVGGNGSGYFFSASVPSGDPNSLLLANTPNEPVPKEQRFVSPGDLIRFGYAGIWYRIDDIDQGQGHTSPNDTVLRISILTHTLTPPSGIGYQAWPANPAGSDANRPFATPQKVPYQIMRKPRVSGTMTLELPRDTSIDLSISGIGKPNYENAFFAANNPQDAVNGTYDANYADPMPIDIVFDPNGQVNMLMVSGVMQQFDASIFLHIGNTESIVSGIGGRGMQPNPAFPATQLSASQNLANSDTYWVAIQYPTGAILTAENFGSAAPDLTLARDIVRSGVAKGSK